MTVPTWKRRLSGAEYVYQLYRLNIRLGEILVNKPQKYKANYTDQIIRTALEALEHAQTADSVYLSKSSRPDDYLLRRRELQLARGRVQHLATACYIFLEIVRKHDYAAQSDRAKEGRLSAKLYDQALEIGEACERCHALIAGVIKSDAELYNRYIRPRTGS